MLPNLKKQELKRPVYCIKLATPFVFLVLLCGVHLLPNGDFLRFCFSFPPLVVFRLQGFGVGISRVRGIRDHTGSRGRRGRDSRRAGELIIQPGQVLVGQGRHTCSSLL